MSKQLEFLDQDEIKELAKATAHWLSYKKLSGFKDLFSESSLLVPVAEYFLGKQWKIAAEKDCHEIFGGIGKKGFVYYDLVAYMDELLDIRLPKIILEMKFLKGNDARVIRDLVKLAIPPGSNCQRLLLVARDSSYQSGLVDKLKKCQSLNVRGVENDCELFLDESPLPLENKEVRASIYKDANFASPVQKILITKSADESADEGKEDVIIFTVSRG